MKLKIFLAASLVLMFLCYMPSFGSAKVEARTDQRIELLSIVFRLAGNDEYNMNNFKEYVADIDKWFAPYKNHPVVAMAKRLRMTHGVSYDAVMSMAIHLGQPPALKPVIPLGSGRLDARWGKRDAKRFVKLLRAFYLESNFEQFYAAHQTMYTLAESRMDKVLTKIDLDWFEKFYGVSSGGKFNLILGIGNGGGNYGPKVVYPDGSEDLYAIMGTWMIGPDGNPNYSDDIIGTIIHEFNHSFVNPLIDKNLRVLQKPGEALFKPVGEQMKKMAYSNWKTVMYESLVRAASIQYFVDSRVSASQIKRLTVAELSNGFLWTDQLVALLADYQANRTQYPDLSGFMPRIAALYERIAPGIDQLKSDFESRCARVDAIEPFANGAKDVDPSITEMRIRFDKPLNTKAGYSITYGEKGAEHFAITGKPQFSDDGRYLIVNVLLKPEWDYSFVLMPWSFRTLDEYPLVTYPVNFSTRK